MMDDYDYPNYLRNLDSDSQVQGQFFQERQFINQEKMIGQFLLDIERNMTSDSCHPSV